MNNMELDAEQRKAVETLTGPVCIIAGPGSGKTRVLTERIAALIQKGTPPQSILAITFTNKAAREMLERLQGRVNGELSHIKTFHAFTYDILKKHAALVGLSADFSAPPIFDDLIPLTLRLFREQPHILAEHQNRFQHILVDEYQDTDEAQTELLDLLAAPRKNFCVVGDPDQAIYSFRGATPENFLSFTARYPDASTITLTRNYRSTKAIAGAASGFMQKEKASDSNAQDELIQIVSTGSARQEAVFILRTIRALIGGGDHLDLDRRAASFSLGREYNLNEIAILYRLNAIGRSLAKIFSDAGIPFQLVGDKSLFEYKEVKDVLAHLRRAPFGTTVGDDLKTVIESGKFKALDNGTPEGAQKYDRLLELATLAAQFGDLSAADGRAELLKLAELSRPEEKYDPHKQAVTLMSVHAAKGLEFPVVFVAACEENVFPSPKADENEERRLFYVAMTRAKELLYLTHTAERMLFGKRLTGEPSRFLADIPADCVKRIALRSRPTKPKPPEHLRLF
jgi:superfamily I DNA/RNA helicase